MDEAWILLEAYASQQDEAAFASLVQRHLGLVYSAALRQLGEPAAAEEVSQAVFVLLAQKAGSLRPTGSLGAWLYRAACLKAKKFRHKEIARRQREQWAHDMNDAPPPGCQPPVDWQQIAPLLDAAMASLSESNRTAVLLRYFEKRSLRDVGSALGLSEEAARKRVDRSLEKLRLWFVRRGVTCSALALGATLDLNSVQSLPATLTVSAIQSAVAQHAASAAAASTTSLLTAMASTKTLFTASLLLAALVPISLPYLRPDPSLVSPAPPPPPATARLSLPSAKSSGLIAEWESLMARYGPSNGSLAQVYEAIQDISDDFRRRALRGALITEWIARAPKEAFAYFNAHDRGQVLHCLREWLRADPAASIAAMQEDPEGLKHFIEQLLLEVAETSPSAVPSLSQHMEEATSWRHPVRDAFAVLAAANPKDALAATGSLEGSQKAEALAGVAMGWAKRDGKAALTWAQSLDAGTPGKDGILRSLLTGWAESDPAAALDHLGIAPPGGSEREFANDTGGQVLRAAAKADFEATLAWIGENPGKLGSESLNGLSEEFGARLRADPRAFLERLGDHPANADLIHALGSQLLNEGYAQKDAVWEWLEDQEDSTFVRDTRMRLVQSAAFKDPKTALGWLDQSPGHFSSDEVSTLIDSMFNNGSDLAAVEGILDEINGPLRDAVLSRSFHHLQSTESPTLDNWIARLDQLPEEDRPAASGAVARQLASMDPARAVAWAESLTDAQQSAAAFSGAVSSWASLDSYECSEWIANLPPGPPRDHAARTLIDSIIQVEPDSAWHWAKTIEDPELRVPALQQAFQLMVSRDPQTANSWLQDPSLSPSDLENLNP